jgi:hypothetical protein
MVPVHLGAIDPAVDPDRHRPAIASEQDSQCQ